MKQIPWLVVLFALACGKSAESKQQKDPKKPDTVKPEPTASGSLVGFYRVDSIDADGETTKLEEAFRKSLKGDASLELDFMRMTINFTADKLTAASDQVLGSKGDASYCSVAATIAYTLEGDHFTIPGIEAVAKAGVVKSKGDASDRNTTTDTSSCNVSLGKGKALTFTIKRKGKNLDLDTVSEGSPITLHLVPDEPEVDLKERAKKFAAR